MLLFPSRPLALNQCICTIAILVPLEDQSPLGTNPAAGLSKNDVLILGKRSRGGKNALEPYAARSWLCDPA